MSINFRIAKERDVPFITKVYNQNIASRTVTADLQPISVDTKLKSFKQHGAKRPIWIVNLNNRRAGWVSLESFYGRPAYHATAEISIYIDKPFQHHGLGKKTLKFVERQTKKLGLHTILAFIFDVNRPSLKLFKAMGFAQYGRLPKVADMGNQIISLDILGKRY